MNYEIKRLDECCISISDGDHLPPPKSDSGVPFITISNIDTTNNTIDFSNSMFVPESYYDSLHDIRKAVSGDILYSVVGTFGVPVLIRREKKFVFQRHIAILRPNKNVVLPEYLYYVMKSGSFYTQADAFAIGSAQRTIGLGALRKMKASIPCIEDQAKAVAVLATYDNLIEVNNKKINLLEQMVENLYKEWFVRFRFPGYKDAEFENRIPKGWVMKKVKEVVWRLPFGRLYKTEDTEREGNVIVIDQSQDQYVGFHNDEPSHVASADEPIAIFGDHSCKHQLMICPFSLSENVVPFVGKDEVLTTYLYFLTRGIIETTEYKRHWTEFMAKKVLVAPKYLQKRFVEQVLPLIKLIQIETEKERNLIKQRDLLLPRLMSGKLEV